VWLVTSDVRLQYLAQAAQYSLSRDAYVTYIAGMRADMLCTSLTKSFSGHGDVMAGSLVLNSAERDPLRKPWPQQNLVVRSGSGAAVPPRCVSRMVRFNRNKKGFDFVG
jgi:hypothetical protein